jgi:uncharacterized protein YprB with RNaseH-like and TPR domain
LFSTKLRQKLAALLTGPRAAPEGHVSAGKLGGGPSIAGEEGAYDPTVGAGSAGAECGPGLRESPIGYADAGRVSADPIGVEEYLPGGEVETGSGPVFVHECLLSGLRDDARELRRSLRAVEDGTAKCGWDQARALIDVLGPWAGRALFLDLETTGLYGSPLFLAGFLMPVEDDFVIRQLFARDYSEEKAVLLEAERSLAECRALVTFNGKSYDVPFMRERAAYHRMRFESLDGKPHLDLLHWSRRRWKGSVTDCKLKTLEWEICRQRRWGDVPGDQIPGIYHRYVRTGDPYQLVPIFHHNVLDLVTMVELTARLVE